MEVGDEVVGWERTELPLDGFPLTPIDGLMAARRLIVSPEVDWPFPR